MDKQQIIHSFWSGFGIPAYDENSVPDGMRSVYPRITYDVVLASDCIGESAMSATLWDRSASWSTIVAKYNEISGSLSNGGVILPYDGGGMWIKKADPFAQRMGDDSDDSVRRIVLNISVEFISNS